MKFARKFKNPLNNFKVKYIMQKPSSTKCGSDHVSLPYNNTVIVVIVGTT